MTQDEIDIMWQKAMQESIKDGEMYTRYHFAKLVAERALADPMREVQRLGQEIEQEPVAWKLLGSAHFRKTLPKNADVTAWNPLYSAPQRSWVGLSEKKQWEIARNISCFDWGELMRETEQALKELNT